MIFNYSQVSYFTLAAYSDPGLLKYMIFVIVLFFYIFIIVSNLLLIVVICMNRSLHEPMYLFLCSLFFNELYGSTSLFPLLLFHIVSDVHSVSSTFCFLQNFCLYSYGGAEYLILAVMSYDRYLAICCPLQYNTHMTTNRIAALIGVTWLCPLLLCLVMTSFSNSLRLCGNIIDKVYCDNFSIVKLSCDDTSANNIYGLFVTCCSILCPLILIFFSYAKILRICFSGCKHTRQKAVSTCTPHLASLLNFSFGASFEIMQSRFNMNKIPNMFRIFLSLYWLTCQPLLNPLVYGFTLSKMRIICKGLIFSEM